MVWIENNYNATEKLSFIIGTVMLPKSDKEYNVYELMSFTGLLNTGSSAMLSIPRSAMCTAKSIVLSKPNKYCTILTHVKGWTKHNYGHCFTEKGVCFQGDTHQCVCIITFSPFLYYLQSEHLYKIALSQAEVKTCLERISMLIDYVAI